MPADHTMPSTSTHHSNAADPYPCHAKPNPPGSAWSIPYGFCRTSLDELAGSADPRCPGSCPHKAPAAVVQRFTKLFQWRGAKAAAEWARDVRNG